MKVKLSFSSGPLHGQSFLISDIAHIGRHGSNDLPVDDPSVSSRHGAIYFHDGKACIQDNESTNGTTVNGDPITSAFLNDGDVVAMGEVSFKVHFVPDEPVVPSEVIPAHPEPVAPPVVKPEEPVHLEITVPDPVQPPLPGHTDEEVKITIIPAHPGMDVTKPRTDEPLPEIRATKVMDRPLKSYRKPWRVPGWVRAAAAVLVVIVAIAALIRGCTPERNMLSASAKKAAYRQMNRKGVELTIQEPAGVDRKADPVTSGVPLPEGSVKDVKELCLVGSDKKPTPCQFTPLCRWPDGSIKWVLLDFQADVAASNKVAYTLTKDGDSPLPVAPVKLESAGDAVVLGSGPLTVTISTNLPGLFHSVKQGDREVITATNPVQAVMVDHDGRIYKGSTPTKIEAECVGPMRTTLLVQGRFEDENGSNIFGGKVGYDLRITAYAGKSDLKLDFTLKNDGWYGYRNEGKNHPRQWLYFKSLRLDIPRGSSSDECTVTLANTDCQLPSTGLVSAVQWYRYPTLNARNYQELFFDDEDLRASGAGGLTRKGYYFSFEKNGVAGGMPGKLPGYVKIQNPTGVSLGMTVKRFWQNFPRGLEVTPDRMSFVMFPAGGFWPRTQEAHDRSTYQFEGGRRKTAYLLLSLNEDPDLATLDHSLFARADSGWYRDTGCVLPFSNGDLESEDSGLQEALHRYDGLQRSKVNVAFGEHPGGERPLVTEMGGQISIPALQESAADVMSGWINYGDLIWGWGYCSLYYEWPYSMLQQYLRLGDREFLDVGDDMVCHRYDIDQYHVENTESHLGGFARYEKGEHGFLSRQDEYNQKWEQNAKASHTWNRGLLLHWVLTGDPRSLDAAQQNGRAYYRFLYRQHKLGEKKTLPWAEFRVPVWAMENWMALYEYTGNPEFLRWANEVFDKSLLAMERDNGSCGHIIKDGKQGAQFTGYMVEPVCRLHHLTARKDTLQFLDRVLGWQRSEGTLRGYTRDGVYYPLLWKEDWGIDPGPTNRVLLGAGNHYDFLFADGFSYLNHVLGQRTDDHLFARQLFEEGIFYYGLSNGAKPGERTPIGYHFLTKAFGSTPKVHAWTGRYSQLYLQMEEEDGHTTQPNRP